MFDVNMPVEDDEDGRLEYGEEYRKELFHAFEESPEGIACRERLGNLGWSDTFLYYGLQYVGCRPQDLSPGDFDEILFDLFPRKVSTEPETAPEIVEELRAFWTFLHREYDVPNARAMLARLDEKATQRLKRELSNTGNFGMAKSIFTMGQKFGFDMTSQQGLNQFAAYYNAHLAGGLPPDGYDDFEVEEGDFDGPFDALPEIAHRQSKQRKPLLPAMSADERKAFSRQRKSQLRAALKKRR